MILDFLKQDPLEMIFAAAKNYNKRSRSRTIWFNRVYLWILIIKLDQKIKMIKKTKKILNSAANLYYGRELVINASKSRIFPLKLTTATGL